MKHEHHTTNFGIEVTSGEANEPTVHHVVPAHVDEHAPEELLTGHHPDHGTNFGLILPVEIEDED